MVWISGNKYLTRAEMENNALLIYGYFNAKGWTLESICGMLGNMESESTVNPGLWESLIVGNMNDGFGLVQWTPARNYINWAGSNYADGTRQCERIIYELENGEQWYETPTYPISFREFTQSNGSPYDLAMAFLANYERPLNPNQPIRGVQANNWYAFLSGEEPPDPPDPPFGQRKKMPLYFYLRRRF